MLRVCKILRKNETVPHQTCGWDGRRQCIRQRCEKPIEEEFCSHSSLHQCLSRAKKIRKNFLLPGKVSYSFGHKDPHRDLLQCLEYGKWHKSGQSSFAEVTS